MCHHYRGHRTPPEYLADEFSIRTNLKQLMLPEAGYYPLSQVPIIRLDQAGERELVMASWGLLPFWWKPSPTTAKPAAFQRKCFNARSEDVDTKPTFREAFKRRRCLLPADEFFEKGHYFYLREEEPFALAGLWETWHGGDGEPVTSCAMLTTAPNSLVGAVHHRMPVMLVEEHEYAAWLNPDFVERGPLEGLLRPLDTELMASRPKG